MKRRGLAILLAVVMVLSLLPMSALAADGDQLAAPTGLAWDTDDLYATIATWDPLPDETQLSAYQIEYYISETEDGARRMITSEDYQWIGDGIISPDENYGYAHDIILMLGTGYYSFRVRALSSDGSAYQDSPWSDYSDAYYQQDDPMLYVAGTNVIDGGYWTGDGAGGITPGTASNYTVRYEPDSKTLTLKDAEITKAYNHEFITAGRFPVGHVLESAGIYAARIDGLTLNLEGKNTITTPNLSVSDLDQTIEAPESEYGPPGLELESFGILSVFSSQEEALHDGGNTLTVSGTGSCTVTAGNIDGTGVDNLHSFGMFVDDLTLNGGILSCTGGNASAPTFSSSESNKGRGNAGSYGILGDATVKNGTLAARGGAFTGDGVSYGIYGDPVLEAGTLEAYGDSVTGTEFALSAGIFYPAYSAGTFTLGDDNTQTAQTLKVGSGTVPAENPNASSAPIANGRLDVSGTYWWRSTRDGEFTSSTGDAISYDTYLEVTTVDPNAVTYLDSGDKTMPKLTKAQITELLANAPTDMTDDPSEIYDVAPSLTAPYAPGKVKTQYLQQATDRLNALRNLAGLASVTLDEDMSENAQYGAVLMAASVYGHEPPQPADMDDAFYSRGYAATSSSNIAWASWEGFLVDAVDSWMDDSDAHNVEVVGHRRWQLNPGMGKVGFGYVEADVSYADETAHDKSVSGVDYNFISWPASGYFPSNTWAFNANTPWSITLNPEKYSGRSTYRGDNDFLENVTVTLERTSDGQTWVFSKDKMYEVSDDGEYFHTDLDGYGDAANCIVFRPGGITEYEGVYTVTVDGLKDAAGEDVDFAYQVEFFAAPPYEIYFDGNGRGTYYSRMTDINGKLSELPTLTRDNYSFDGWYTDPTGGTKISTSTVFTKETTLYAHWTSQSTGGGGGGGTGGGGSTSGGGSSTSGGGGSTSGGGSSTSGGSTSGGGSSTSGGGSSTSGGGSTGTGDAGFVDVLPDKWYNEGINYAVENGMMKGVGDNRFDPDGVTTRAMVVTILHRLEDEPAAAASPFTDVASGSWYEDAVNWAAETGVVKGTSETTFSPNGTITREQLATMLYRYAENAGYDVSLTADLTGFTDSGRISNFAANAMSWAVSAGLIAGTSETTLSPADSATRAQVATILMRFCEGMAE